MADGWKMQFIQNRGKTSEGILMSRVLGSSNETIKKGRFQQT